MTKTNKYQRGMLSLLPLPPNWKKFQGNLGCNNFPGYISCKGQRFESGAT